MRRRVREPARLPGDPPAELLTFHYRDWGDDDEDPPDYWTGDALLWRLIRARRRWSDARRAYCADNGVSRDAWAAIEARHGIGVVVAE